jgi:hypothetical protein
VSPRPETGRSIIWSNLAWILLVAVFSTAVYRAVTQSITIDEAYSYQNFVSKPFAGLFEPFDANNHVLNTILERLSVAVFGVSEWSLRLPSLIGAAIYLVATHRLCSVLFDGGIWSLITTALLTTNPFVLDYLSAARGYALSLAFLMLVVYALVHAMETKHSRSEFLAGVFAGFSVAANLTSIFPLTAVIIAFIVVNIQTGRFRLKLFWDELIVPATMVSFAFLVVPVSRAHQSDFYFGGKQLSDTVHSAADFLFGGPIVVPWLRGLGPGIRILHSAVLPLSALLLVVCLFHGIRSDALTRFFALSFVVVVTLVIVAHYFAGVPYPLLRTALYFVPLAVLASSCICFQLRRYRPIRISAALFSIFCILSFIAQVNVLSFAEWRYDAGAKRIVNFIRFRNSSKKHLIVRASWQLEPSLNFYRTLYKLDWEPVDRNGPEQVGDVVVLKVDDASLVQKHGWKTVYRDSVSGALVAIPK